LDGVGSLHPDGANNDDDTTVGPPAQTEDSVNSDVDEAELDPAPATRRDEAGEALTAQRRRALAEARRNEAPAPRESWRKRTATGAVLTGFALGFREALGQEPPKAAIIMEAPGDPPTDLPVDAEVDQIRPADNVVRIRPWLLNNGEGESAGDADDRGKPDAQLAADDPELVDSPSTPIPERAAAPRRRGRR
jgi:hypothetical protein